MNRFLIFLLCILTFACSDSGSDSQALNTLICNDLDKEQEKKSDDKSSTEKSATKDSGACLSECLEKGAEKEICDAYCGSDGQSSGDLKKDYKSPIPLSEIEIDGVRRNYRLFVPKNLPSKAMPLIFAFHGGDEGAGGYFPQEKKWNQLAEQEGFLIVYPYAKTFPPNESAWQLNTNDEWMQDINFVTSLIDRIGQSHPLDSKRIYATGYSLGSMFSYELPCQLSDRFAAIASHAGAMPLNLKNCIAKEPIAIMHLHGTLDCTIPYFNQWDWKRWEHVGTMRAAPELVNFWKEKYNCKKESKTSANSETHSIYDECDGGIRVEHHRLESVGHEWPDTVGGVSTHQVIWNFLNEFKKP